MYFSRLEAEVDEAMAAEAAEHAREADASDVATLAAAFARLAAEHAQAPLSKVALQVLAKRYGSLLGELVRARAGGAWAVGRLFAEPIRGCLLVGDRAIKFWPWLEARDRIEGRAALPLADRIDRLCSRANEDDDGDDEVDDDESPRLYPLKAGEGYFDAGVTRDGRQALMAAFYPMTFAIFFAGDGTFLDYVERPNEDEQPNKGELCRWQTELGFTPQAIRIEMFSIARQGLGIADLRSFDEDLLADPDSEPDEAERAERLRSIRAWIEEGSFVLYWGNDLWLDGTGHVTSS
jgi:hypothetical protein